MINFEFQTCDWPELKLGDVCVFKGGNGFRKRFQGRSNGDYPFIKVSDLNLEENSKYITNAQNWITESELHELHATVQPSGSVVFAKVGAALKLNRRRILTRPTVIDNNMMVAIPDTMQIDSEFLYFFLLVQDFSRFSQEGAVPSVNQKHISSINISLPTLCKQHKIIEILRTWDESLEKLKVLHKNKELNLIGLRNNLIARACHNGQLTTFGSFLTESRIPGSSGGLAKKILVKSRGRGAIIKKQKRIGSKNTQYYRRTTGQIIYSKLAFLNGAFAVISEDLGECESTLDSPAFDCDHKINPQWLIEYLIRPSYYTSQTHLARGLRKARRVSPEDWLASSVRLPERKEQDNIVKILEAAKADLSVTEEMIVAVTKQRQGLMQKLLTGKLQISVKISD